VTPYFHWNRELSRVDLADGQTFGAGYNLVIWNQGPATTYEVVVGAPAQEDAQVRLGM
jgi:hypothetical protein